MKKIFFAGFVLFLTHLCFAIPNMKLYENAEFLYQISDNFIYDENGDLVFEIRGNELYCENEYAGTIIEDDDILSMDFYFESEENRAYLESSKKTGFLLILRLTEEEKCFVSEYDEKTGLKKKRSCYADGQLDSYGLYEYENGKIAKISYYHADDSSDGYYRFVYDKRTGCKISESEFDADNHLVQTIEYDFATEKRTRKLNYNDDGSVKAKTVYDKTSGNAAERFVYGANAKKPTKWTFIPFDDDRNYALNKDFYLNADFCRYGELKRYSEDSKTEPIEWNDLYSAVVRKYDFNERVAGYSYIENLIRARYLTEYPFTLCSSNSNLYYCFAATDDDKIDLSSCYEIKLIEKPRNYTAMNKSGRGSGPFGFDIGMSYGEIKEVCGGSEPEHIADDRYYVKPKKAHPLFEKYIVWISDSVGLYYVKGISRDISASDYGTEAKRQFSNLLAVLEKKYGRFSLTDTIAPDYYWKDEKHWMQALKDGARTYRAKWSVTKENYENFNGLCEIMFGINSANKYSASEAYIWIEYEFLNYGDAKEALNDVL
ncbi:MAG: hypothetical protein NC041_03210 [Bacteroides sp.]|nr:hypothetical protein [Prevotella sp.]MCM1408133.1 hypothetical protein [Treponema brennaborense]MCM1469457.1 hypothetical protein [Bacteroides sp.]